MTRSKLIDQISEMYPDLDRTIIRRAVETVFNEISKSLQQGKRVELRGFGAFQLKQRRSRSARNPKTGEKVMVPPKYALRFKAGKEMREIIDSNF